MKKNIVLFTTISVFFIGIGAYFSAQQSKLTSLETPTGVTTALFSQSMVDTSGTPQSLAKWRKKILIVNFWATWCPPCVQEMPELSALQTEIAQKNGQIIGLGIDSADNITKFSLHHHILYPLYIAGMSGLDLSRKFGNTTGGLPFTVLIDAEGNIKKTYTGRLKLQELRKDLAEL